jgi:hypothetical protein
LHVHHAIKAFLGIVDSLIVKRRFSLILENAAARSKVDDRCIAGGGKRSGASEFGDGRGSMPIRGGFFAPDVESRVPTPSRARRHAKRVGNFHSWAVGLQTAQGHPNYEIELRAYQTYLERGGAPGPDVEDWLQAERELLEEYKKIGRTTKATASSVESPIQTAHNNLLRVVVACRP